MWYSCNVRASVEGHQVFIVYPKAVCPIGMDVPLLPNTGNILCGLNGQFVSVLPTALTENVIEYQGACDAIGYQKGQV